MQKLVCLQCAFLVRDYNYCTKRLWYKFPLFGGTWCLRFFPHPCQNCNCMPRTAIKLRSVSMTFAKTISTESANELIAVHIVIVHWRLWAYCFSKNQTQTFWSFIHCNQCNAGHSRVRKKLIFLLGITSFRHQWICTEAFYPNHGNLDSNWKWILGFGVHYRMTPLLKL